jgi:drug/metabolite transporter (DMT)-like permease
MAALLTGTFLWSSGSLLSRRLPSPSSNALASALAMLVGGTVLLSLAGLQGEWRLLSRQALAPRSLMALAYLVLFGSLLAFCSYNWLIRTEKPTLVGTCTFVNPLVAVLLGWSLAGETLSPQALLGGTVIVASVVLLWMPHRAKPLKEVPLATDR